MRSPRIDEVHEVLEVLSWQAVEVLERALDRECQDWAALKTEEL